MSDPVETVSNEPEAPAPRPAAPAGGGLLNRYVSRFGRTTLILLAVIVAAGFLARAWFVVNPHSDPGDDALAYRALAESLYDEGTYGGSEFKSASDWSPGAPLLYAASYYLTGGVRDGVARGVEAVAGTAAIVVVFLLAARLSQAVGGRRGGISESPPRDGPFAVAPLLAAALVAFYPPFVDSAGSLMSEPPAYFLLPAGLLALFWAESRRDLLPWLLPGFLFGLTTLVRPEYMAVTAALGLLALIRVGVTVNWSKALPAFVLFGLAALLPVIPWTIHNYVTLDRVVPISTGSGKALFTGTYLPGDGEYKRVKSELLFDQTGERLEPGSSELEAVDPVPLFDRVAEENYPELDRDAALGRVGRENLDHYLSTDPLAYLGMTIRKVGRMWGTSSGGVMSSGIGALVQKLLVLTGLAGLALLAWRRRWEAAALAVPVLGITAIGALTLAPPRRNEILMTLVLPLAAVAFTAVLDRFHSSESTS
ncbi:MAG: glycosyltransferase family 39 protein [Actinomycetota bacterium]|nr:glycosyltransferase family 39 protein [Actinomycetota bacterium]